MTKFEKIENILRKIEKNWENLRKFEKFSKFQKICAIIRACPFACASETSESSCTLCKVHHLLAMDGDSPAAGGRGGDSCPWNVADMSWSVLDWLGENVGRQHGVAAAAAAPTTGSGAICILCWVTIFSAAFWKNAHIQHSTSKNAQIQHSTSGGPALKESASSSYTSSWSSFYVYKFDRGLRGSPRLRCIKESSRQCMST